MGFEVTKSARLVFEPGTLLEGATVRVRTNMQIREFLALQRKVAALGSDFKNMSEEDVATYEALYRTFADEVLLDWDLEEAGRGAIPLTGDEFIALGFAIDNEIFKAWASVVGGPGPNSRAASANGATPEAEPALTAAG